MLRLASSLPTAILDLVTSESSAPYSVVAYLLGGFAVFALGYVGYAALGERSEDLRPVAFAAALSLLAYCMVGTYASGSSRYLFSLYPVLVLAYGLLERFFLSPAWVPKVALTLVLGASIAWQIQAQAKFGSDPESAKRFQAYRDTLERFQSAGVDFVYSDDYSASHVLTLVSGEKQIVAPPLDWLAPIRILKRAEDPPAHAGFLFSRSVPRDAVLSFANRKWTIRSLGRIGERELYDGWLVKSK
jgi:hypothetical protein